MSTPPPLNPGDGMVIVFRCTMSASLMSTPLPAPRRRHGYCVLLHLVCFLHVHPPPRTQASDGLVIVNCCNCLPPSCSSPPPLDPGDGMVIAFCLTLSASFMNSWISEEERVAPIRLVTCNINRIKPFVI